MKMNNIKKPLGIFGALLVFGFTLSAFQPCEITRDGRVNVKIIKYDNGKIEVTDTTFDTNQGLSIDEYLAQKGIEKREAYMIELDESRKPEENMYFIRFDVKKTLKTMGEKGNKKVFIHQAENGEAGESKEVKIEKNVDEDGKVMVRKWVNGEEVPVTEEDLELENVHLQNDENGEMLIEIEDEQRDGDQERSHQIWIQKDGDTTVINNKKIAHVIEEGGQKKIFIERVQDIDIEESEDGKPVKKMIRIQKKDGDQALFITDQLHDEQVIRSNVDVDIRKTTVIVRYLDENETEKSDDLDEASTLQLNALSFFPNPNQGKFKLEFELAEKGQSNITIHKGDASGQLVFEDTNHKKRYKKEVDLTSYGKGLYILSIRQGDKVIHERILLQ